MSDSARKRDRSPAFPQVPLGDAVDRLVAFERHFGRHPALLHKAGAAWGLKQCGEILASLRYFGFLEYAGNVTGRQVMITNEGRNLLHAQQETTKQEIIRQAALRPKEVAKFWPIWGSDRPPDDACLHELISHNGFSARGAPLFLASYDGTIAFARLRTPNKIASDPPAGADIGGSVESEASEEQGERVVFTEEGLPNQYLKLVASGAIDDGLLDALEDFVKRQRKRLEFLKQSAGVAQRPLPGAEPPEPDPEGY